ncbi:MAG: plasmid replication protein RepC [Paracoccaceae bacterium]|nr:plasmid replication protein RepC [Paracoccaceae bacterium]
MPGPSGWRKATAGLARAERLAEAGLSAGVPKSRAFVAVKRIGTHVGLKAGDLMLLDTLGAFTQTQDWEQGRRPIVWASNAYLMEQTGFSLSALKRHARRLAEAGVIAFKDSPNGKRWGKRDEDGIIIEAYGFDLSPLAARAEEFEQLQAELQAERELCQFLKRQITVSRRMIRARLEAALSGALRGPWAQLQEVFEELLGKLPRRIVASQTLDRLLGWFNDLQERVEAAFLKATRPAEPAEKQSLTQGETTEKTRKMNPTEVNSEPDIQITNHPDPVISNRSENEQAAGVLGDPEPGAPIERPAEDEPQTEAKPRGVALDVSTIMQACPEFATWARDLDGYLKDWGDVYRVAGRLRPMIGVSEQAWAAAQEGLGKQAATAAMVLVFDKHAKGEVASPGGYLRGMVEKAVAGELHLERSIYGRLSGQAA